MKNELDQETQRIAQQGAELKAMCESEGWKIAKQKLYEKVANLLNINSTEILNAEASTIIQVIASRKTAADILGQFIKDIEGDVEQHQGNKEMMQAVDEIFIVRQGNN